MFYSLDIELLIKVVLANFTLEQVNMTILTMITNSTQNITYYNVNNYINID